jgi:HAD superfamily hydrolase (TIGR01484 family)
MKIYYASQSFYPHIGGVPTYLLNLAKEMLKNGNEVVEVHLRPSGEIHHDEIKGIEIHRVPRDPIKKDIMKGYSKFKETVYKESHYNKKEFTKNHHEMPGYEEFNKVNEFFGEQLKELLEDNPADIVHIHDFQLLFAYRYVPRGTPLILTWHIPFIENMSKPLADFLIKNMIEYDKIVFSSKEYIDAAVKLGLPEEKAELIYPIANTEQFKILDIDKKTERKKYNIPVDCKMILCVQRIDPKSGHEQLIKAMPQILKEVPDAKLVFVGGESMSNKISKDREALVKNVKKLVEDLKLEKDVLFTGNIDYLEIPRIYNSADVVTLCSKNEGFGLSVTEGMACGNPIVGTRVGGIPIQVKDGENGFLVETGDVDATAKSLIKILKDEKLREKMALKSLERVDKYFKMEVGIEKHLILYNDLIKQKDEFHKIEYLDVSEIRGIITDLDRTLTDEPGKPEFDAADYDEELFKELESLKENDIDIFLATGRNINYVKKLCDRFKIWRAVVAENGAMLYMPDSKKVITIDTEYMKKAREIVKKMDLKGCVVGDVLISIKAKDEEKVREALGELCKNLNFVLNVDEIMILPLNVDKGLGLRMAMQYLNIDMEKTISIGDGENDVDMFLNPGFKIALANAKPKLKKIANQVLTKPSTKGVREVIKRLKSNGTKS